MIEGDVRPGVAAPRPRPAADPDRAGRRRQRPDLGDVVQPAVAEGQARCPGRTSGCAASATATASQVSLVRPRTAARATADFAPVYPASEEVSAAKLRGARRGGAAARDATARPAARRRSRPARGLPLRGDALVALHRPRSLDEAEEGRRRLAFDELLVLQLALARRAAEREAAVAAALPAPGELIGRYRAALPFDADRAPGAGDRGDRRRPRADDADAAAAAGRRRLGQDGRRALRAPARCRGRPPGRADGADGDARRAALPHHRGDLRASSASAAPSSPAPSSRSIGGTTADVVVGTHALIQKGFEFARPRRGGRRRAAPLRRRAALARSPRAARRTCCT